MFLNLGVMVVQELDVHERHFKVVHEHIIFALLRMGNHMREHTFGVSKSR